MSNFKYGDRLVSRDGGQVVEFNLRSLGGSDFFHATNGAFYALDDFTRIEHAIVAVVEYGRPRPSNNPYVHLTREAAEKEARRLGNANPGQEFDVYVRASTSGAKVTPATTKAA